MAETYRPRDHDLAGKLDRDNGRRRSLDFIEVSVPRRDPEADLRERALAHLRERGVREFRGDPIAVLGWRKDNP